MVYTNKGYSDFLPQLVAMSQFDWPMSMSAVRVYVSHDGFMSALTNVMTKIVVNKSTDYAKLLSTC